MLIGCSRRVMMSISRGVSQRSLWQPSLSGLGRLSTCRLSPVARAGRAPFSSTTVLKINDRKRKEMDEDLKRMDIDVVEKMMSNFSLGRTFTKEDYDKLVVVDRLIPPQTVYHFMDFLFEGNLPGGGRTSFPLLRLDEINLHSQPYNTWAPAPLNQSTSTLEGNINTRFAAEHHALHNIPAKFHVLKTKLWNGMVPISGTRWREKKFDDTNNHYTVFEHMNNILYMFRYLNDAEVQKQLRNGFNWLSAHFADFELALNHRRKQLGISEKMEIVAMWAEYMQAVYTTIPERAFSWISDRVTELHVKAEEEYDATATKSAEDQYEAAKKFLRILADLNKVLSDATYIVSMPMEGYTGREKIPIAWSASTDILSMSLEDRAKVFEKYSLAAHLPVVEKLLVDKEAAMRDRETVSAFYDELTAHTATIRQQIRGSPKPLGNEHWVTIVKSRNDWFLKHGGDPMKQTWGFVAYRLTYKNTPEEWKHYVERLNADLKKAGEWIQGAGDVMGTAGLQWLDGEELGIPENDIEAARKHFATFRTSPDRWVRMWKEDFLVADTFSVQSYLTPHKEQPASKPSATRPQPSLLEGLPPSTHGEHGGHIRLVDMRFDLYDPEVIRVTSPGFKGDMKVKSTLLFDEVYPLLSSIAMMPRELWPLCLLHLEQMYVGPSVPSEEDQWDFFRTMQADSVSNFIRALRERQKKLKEGDEGSPR